MSHITEIAEREAAEAESEEEIVVDDQADVDTEGEDDEQELEARVPDMAKAFDRMQREDERHAKRVQEIMGDDFSLVYPCAHCGELAAGFTLTPPVSSPQLVADAETERCPRCDGWGEVLTGARADRSLTRPCPGCGGTGYRTKLEPLTAVAVTPPAAPVDPMAVAALRAAGYTIVEPYVPPLPSAA